MGDAVIVNPLKYTNPYGETSYINPMTYIGSGGISNYQSSGSNSNYLANSGYSWPSFSYQEGGLARRPQLAKIAERGPEIVLNENITQKIMSAVNGGGQTVVQVFLGEKDLTDIIMKRVVKKMANKGAKF